jgi:tetratricopeptide (TPR) repeat protein
MTECVEHIRLIHSTDEEQKRAHEHNRIILLLMIRNESKIIQRCLQHALPHADAVAILDTGSTDNTIELCKETLDQAQKPYLIRTEPFKNFGYSRTVSFLCAQSLCSKLEWDPTQTYALAVDADMVICPQPAFYSYPLTVNGYNLIQENGHLKYYNMRLMKCSHPWKCVGATHEYWSGDPTEKIPYEVFHIDDRNDGGCKSDKFERDVRLLTEEIREDPKNGRAHYYLGQSLKDLGRFDEAIEMFKKRIELGGWIEEVWYAHLQIGRCYDHKGDEHLMEYWMNKAFQYHSKRAEPLYHLTRYFREKSQHYKAYHYYQKGRYIPFPKDDVLFIEKQVYEGLFEYENTILSCYVRPFPHEKLESQIEIIQYLNRWPHYHQNVFDNLVFYANPLDGPVYGGTYQKLLLPPHQEYEASSCSLLPFSQTDKNRRYVLNARYVNYSIDSQGCYHMRSPDGHVKTKNGLVYLNEFYQPTEKVRVLTEEFRAHPSNIEGLEDIRLFYHNNKLQFTASSKNITPTNKVVIVYGDYSTDQARVENLKVLAPPRPSDCEKNWIYVPSSYLKSVSAAVQQPTQPNFLFGWHPLQIGVILPEEADDVYHGQLKIHTVQNTPSFFTHFRGSSPLVEYNNKVYAVVHHVKYCTPRNYMHALIQFNKDTMRVERYTPLFCFRKTAIEYCIGFHIQNDTATFVFSENDCDPGMIHVPFRNFRWLMV